MTAASGEGREEGEEVLDLLGDPVRPYVDPRGRPKVRVDNELRRRVAVLAAGGMTQAVIADVVGLSEPTLRQYFFAELHEGKAAKRAEVIEAMFEAAKAGNVTAQRAFLGLGEKGDMSAPPRRRAAEPKLGKKEQLTRDAQKPLSGWGDLLPSQQVN
jgi:hypothetical protein